MNLQIEIYVVVSCLFSWVAAVIYPKKKKMKKSTKSMVEYGQRWLLVEDNGNLPWRPSHNKKNNKELEMWSHTVGKWVDLV